MRVVSTLLLLVLAACGKPPMPQMPSVVPVTSAVVSVQDVPQTHKYPGQIASVRPVQLTARVAGFLLRQEVPDGSTVKAGQVVYRIDPTQYLAQLAQAEAALAKAAADQSFADSEVVRNKPLAAAGAISQQDFDLLVTKAEVAAADVEYQKSSVELQKLNVGYCTIASPLDGVLGKSQEFEGSMVGPGYPTNLNLVVQMDPIWAQFSPSTSQWPTFMEQMAQGSVAATVAFGLKSPISSQGKLVFHNNQAGTSTSSMMMRAEIPNPKGLFVPGAMVDVEVSLGTIKGAMVVPLASLWARETELFVWRIKADSIVEAVSVKVLLREGDHAVLGSGVSAGDKVVVNGVQKLRAGSKVIETPGVPLNPPPSAATLGQGHGATAGAKN